MFGEIIGAWISQVWQDIGAPSDFALVEMGPGRGTLMRDILRICCKNMDFKNAADVRLIETSPVLSKQQQATLSGYDVKWQNEFHDDFDKPIIFIANELLDALPIHQFVKKSAGWQERYIGLSRDSNLEVRLAAPSFDPRLAFQGRSDRHSDVQQCFFFPLRSGNFHLGILKITDFKNIFRNFYKILAKIKSLAPMKIEKSLKTPKLLSKSVSFWRAKRARNF